MGFQVNIDSNIQTVTIVGTGPTDAAGFREILLKAVADPSFRVGYCRWECKNVPKSGMKSVPPPPTDHGNIPLP